MNLIEETQNRGQAPAQAAGNQESAKTAFSHPQNESPEKGPPRSATAQRPERLGPADKVVLSYLTIIGILIIANYGRVKFWWLLVPLHLLAGAVIFALARRVDPGMADQPGTEPDPAPPGRMSIVRSWYPLILIPLTYKELGYLIPLIHPHDFDRELALMDRRILGVDPILWLDRINSPAVTLIMQLAYLTYYVMPIILGIVLWRARRFADFQFFLFVIMLGFYTSYLGYITVPAIGPRFFLDPGSVRPMSGPGVTAIRGFLDQMEGVTRDCFPSGHTELTLLVLFCAHRFHKRAFYILLPAGTALIISTVYLRYHYVIDVIAGAAVAVGIAMTADWLYKVAVGRVVNRSASL